MEFAQDCRFSNFHFSEHFKLRLKVPMGKTPSADEAHVKRSKSSWLATKWTLLWNCFVLFPKSSMNFSLSTSVIYGKRFMIYHNKLTLSHLVYHLYVSTPVVTNSRHSHIVTWILQVVHSTLSLKVKLVIHFLHLCIYCFLYNLLPFSFLRFSLYRIMSIKLQPLWFFLWSSSQPACESVDWYTEWQSNPRWLTSSLNPEREHAAEEHVASCATWLTCLLCQS